jgi:uncharacterized SAM-binding protein YcdF (DUF218 family)
MIITSGWGEPGYASQAEVLKETAMLLGVDSKFIKMQINPKNTMMEAKEYKHLFGDSSKLIVVTSALHMPRAMHLFRQEGLYPIPAPTNHIIKKGKNYNPWLGMPSSENIHKMESAVHEYVGLLWYKFGGQ